MKLLPLIFTAVQFVSPAAVAQPGENVIDQRTIPVSLDLEELSLTCRMGSNGLSYISLNSPSLERALESNIHLKATGQPVLRLTSAFVSDSVNCQQNNQDLVEFIVNGEQAKAPINIELSLVEVTSSSFGFKRRILTETFRVLLNSKLSFGNSSSILLHQEETDD